MKTYNRSEIVKNAWNLYKRGGAISFKAAMKAAWMKAKKDCSVWVCGGTTPVSIYTAGQEMFVKMIAGKYSLFANIIQEMFETGESRPDVLIAMYDNAISE